MRHAAEIRAYCNACTAGKAGRRTGPRERGSRGAWQLQRDRVGLLLNASSSSARACSRSATGSTMRASVP
jgi:hypothetical protein